MAIEVNVVGFDIAKNVLQVHGVDRRGAGVLRGRVGISDLDRSVLPIAR